MATDYVEIIVDELMGLLSCSSSCSSADWSVECLRRSSRAWERVARLRFDDDPRALLSSVVEGEVFEALAVGRSARELVSDIVEQFDFYMRSSVRSSSRSSVRSSWGCPDCVDDDDEPVRLVADADGDGLVCPACGCHTVSPVDDACVRLDDDEPDDEPVGLDDDEPDDEPVRLDWVEVVRSGDWSVRRRSDGELVLVSPWEGSSALLSRPADVAGLLDASGCPSSSGALVANMLAWLVI